MRHYGKEAKEVLVIMIYDLMACLVSVNLHGNHKDFVAPSIKLIGKLNDQVKIFKMFHCDGLLLCVSESNSTVMVLVWNPYLGQTRWVQPIKDYHTLDMFAMGYDSNNNHHKILRFSYVLDYIGYEIYGFKSNSWRVLDITTDWRIIRWRGVSVKGNTYVIAQEKLKKEEVKMEEFLVCFDFTSERFGPNALSWSKMLIVDVRLFNKSFLSPYNFFVEEKKKVALICYIDRESSINNKAYIVGEDGYSREVDLEESKSLIIMWSYVPSSVEIQ